jgi:hypothetical protein
VRWRRPAEGRPPVVYEANIRIVFTWFAGKSVEAMAALDVSRSVPGASKPQAAGQSIC